MNNEELFFSTVTVGNKGQIVIPAKLRKRLKIAPGEQLIILANPQQEGFGVLKAKSFLKMQKQFSELQK